MNASEASRVPRGYDARGTSESAESHSTAARHAGSAGTPTSAAVDGVSAAVDVVSALAFLVPPFLAAWVASAGFAANAGALAVASARGAHSPSCHFSQYSCKPRVSSASPRG